MTSDLYSTLGVDRAADKAAIRRAYRKRAKAAHPDGGGSEEKFGALTKAHDILTDDERRARYDATGDASEKAIDNGLSDMLQVASQLLIAAMSRCVERGIEPVYDKLVNHMLDIGRDNLRQIAANREQFALALSRLRRLQGRFIQRAATSEPNALESLLAGQIIGHEQRKSELDKAETAMKAALELIRNYDFKPEEKPKDLKNIGNFFYTEVG